MKLHTSGIALLIFSSAVFSQYVPNSNSGKALEVQETEAKFNLIITNSGRLFKEGLMNIQDNRRLKAREKFDKSIEVFLLSGVNVRANAKLQSCYTQLVETVYRIEFPTAQQPAQIKALTATCGWNIDNELSDSVAKIIAQPIQNNAVAANDKALITSISDRPTQVNNSQVGFSEQKFEVSPLDELAKLELNSQELLEPTTKSKTYCPIPALQKIMPGLTIQQTEKTVGRKFSFSREKGVSGQIGVSSASLILPGTRIVRVRAYKNVIYEVAVVYENLFNWKGLSEFAVTSSKNLELPNRWQFLGTSASLSCTDFKMDALKLDKWYALVVKDSRIDNEIYFAALRLKREMQAEAERKRRQAELADQQKKSTFKP